MINANQARTEQQTLYDRAYLPTTRNTISSSRIEQILNFFEWWDWARLISDEITEYIANMEITPHWWWANFSINQRPANKWQLLKQKSLKDKLAYFISLYWDTSSHRVVNLDDYSLIQDSLRNNLNNLEWFITKNFDLSQKFILRHSALNRFKVDLNKEEKQNLDSIVLKLKKFVSDNNLDNYTFHFWQINDAQKIKKVEETLRILKNSDLSEEIKNVLDSIEKDFNFSDKEWNKLSFSEKLKPLDELDDCYQDMSATLNNMYTYNRWSMNVLSKSSKILWHVDIRRMKIVLSKIEWKDVNLDTYVKNLYYGKEFDLNNKLEEIINKPNINEALKEANLTVEYFSRAYLEHFSQELVIVAKRKLDSKRKEVFWVNKRDYDQDINLWQANQRAKIIEIWHNIIANWWATQEQIFVLTNYLKKNKHVFVLWENEIENEEMRTALDTAIANITPHSQNDEIETLRDVVLDQNYHINNIFYWDTNLFDAKRMNDNPIYGTLNHVRRISTMTSQFSKKYWQAVAKTVVWWALIWGSVYAWYWLLSTVWLSALLSWWAIVWAWYLWAKYSTKVLKAYHTWLNKWSKNKYINAWYSLLKLWKILTVPLEKVWETVDTWPWKILKLIKDTKKKTNDIIEKNIWESKIVKEFTEGKVNSITWLIALWINWLFRGTSELTTIWADFWLDVWDTREKRQLLNWIYSSQNAQNLRELSEQVDIQSIIQEDVWLYDKDWYVEEISLKDDSEDITEEAVKNYENISIKTLDDTIEAEKLRIIAEKEKDKITDPVKKTSFESRINVRKSNIERLKQEIITEEAVKNYEETIITKVDDELVAEWVRKFAVDEKNKIIVPAKKSAFETRINTKKREIDNRILNLKEEALKIVDDNIKKYPGTYIFQPIWDLLTTSIKEGNIIIINETVNDNLIMLVRKVITHWHSVTEYEVDYLQNETWKTHPIKTGQKITLWKDKTWKVWVAFSWTSLIYDSGDSKFCIK